MSSRTIACSSSRTTSATARASSVLPTPVGPRNTNDPFGRFGILEAGARPAKGIRHRRDGVVLADHALVQTVLEMNQLLGLTLEQSIHRDPRPTRHDRGDVVLVDLLLHHRVLRARALRELGLELRDLAVADLRDTLEIALTLGPFGLHPKLVEAPGSVLDPFERPLLLGPTGSEAVSMLLRVGERLLERLACAGILLRHRGQLDLELHHAAVRLVELDRRGVDLHPQARRGLVDQVDCLVRQEAVRDIAVRENRGRDERSIPDPHAVMSFVALLEAAKDRDRVLDGRLVDAHRREAALECRVLLDVLAVLVERGRADAAKLTAGQHRLQQVRGIDGAFGRAGTDDRVQLVDEEDHPAVALLDLGEDGLQALLELAPVLGAGEQRADIERPDGPILQPVGHVAADDPLCKPFGDRRLPHAGLADQDGIVLRPAREDLDHAPDLLVAPDHRVELPVSASSVRSRPYFESAW